MNARAVKHHHLLCKSVQIMLAGLLERHVVLQSKESFEFKMAYRTEVQLEG